MGDNVQIGGRAVGTVDEHRADRRTTRRRSGISVEEPYAPLREGTQAVIRLTSLSGIANRYVALSPGPDASRTLPDARDARHRLDDHRGRPRPALQHARPGGARGPAGRHRGLQDPARRQGRRRPPRRPSTSTRCSRARAGWSTRRPQDEDALTRLHRLLLAHGHRDRRAPRRPRRPGRQRERHHRRDRGREPRAERGAGAAADDAAARQLDVREPARDARRPRPAGRRVQARDQGPGAVPARAAPARARRQADDRRPLARSSAGPAPTTTSSRPRASCRASSASPARRSRAAPARCRRASPCSSSSRPYIPELVGWFRDFGVGAANYDANGHYARIQPIFNAFQLARACRSARRSSCRCRSRSASTACRPACCARCPGAASQPRDGRLGAVPGLGRQPRLRSDPGGGGPVIRRSLADRRADRRRGRRRRRPVRLARGRGALPACARSSTTPGS